ncbi:vWA domain-containing protein [Marimonas lutisalis]|uniref:vWA domain-containing protein n=1 Tax=Marimonas lutisalis TaxID=2545756 RepID=UPI0010F8BF20|nr:VWA domain-containing protein [Marimonas lutisalis]
MTDDLDDLKRLMDQATPASDPASRAAHIALARKNFAEHQENAAAARRNSERPEGGLIKGVANMLAHMSTRGALAATTALVALGVVIALPQLSQAPLPDLQRRSAPVELQTTAEESAPVGLADEAESPAPEGEAPIARALQEAPGTARLRTRSQGAEPSQTLVAPKMAQRPAPGDDLALPGPGPNTESFSNAAQNTLKVAAEDPVSTFSIDVDTASYAVLRSSLTAGQLPPPEAVRIEEMINYFPYDYPAPQAGEAPFKPTVTVTPTPWNSGTRLVHIGIQGRKPVTDTRPPLNLVFLIDTSGSMNQPDKLPLLKQSLALMLPRLDARDQVSIVTYAGSAGQVLAPTPASARGTILAALDALSAGGSTAGQAGLQQAYAVADSMATEGEVTRVILATDGDFNVGLSDPDALKNYIAQKRDSGTYLSVLGFGRGNLDDATMQALAQNGNGQAAYIDTLNEAQKVLVDQFSGALFPIANDVKIQVEFNSAQIAEYRLIGYETRALNREDFNNDKVDAGDIGAGHTVTAIYEITPVDSPARLTDPLRYGATEPGTDLRGELGYLKLRYKAPGAEQSELIETPIQPGSAASDDIRFAAAIAGFGQLLTGSQYLGDWGYEQMIALAVDARGDDPFGYRAEAVRLMRLAASLSR